MMFWVQARCWLLVDGLLFYMGTFFLSMVGTLVEVFFSFSSWRSVSFRYPYTRRGVASTQASAYFSMIAQHNNDQINFHMFLLARDVHYLHSLIANTTSP